MALDRSKISTRPGKIPILRRDGVSNIPLLKLKECEGIVYRGMVLVSTDAAAVKGDDDVNVVRYHVLLLY